MRVSSNQILEAGVNSMENSLAEAMAWQKKISTGKNYSKASDNPYAVSRGVRLEFDVARFNDAVVGLGRYRYASGSEHRGRRFF